MYKNFNREDINNTFVGQNDVNMDVDININNQQAMLNYGNVMQPIIEPMQERVVNRTIMHEVPHICPIRTRIVNNHVYRHTYRPSFSCCEENVISNMQCGSCCNNKF